MLIEPLDKVTAAQTARRMLDAGEYSVSTHAVEEMAKDDMDIVDAINVVRAGIVTHIDPIKGTWRYRFSTRKMAVVIAFPSENALRVVTAWRF